MKLSEEFRENKTLMYITSREKEKKTINDIQQELIKLNKRTGYLILERPFKEVKRELENKKANPDNFFFVDIYTAGKETPPIVDNCIFISSPEALTEIRVAISTLYAEKNRELIFIENIGEMIKSHDIFFLTRFINNLILKAEGLNRKLILLIVKEENTRHLIKDIAMFADKVIEI
jgi:hypothetical protein